MATEILRPVKGKGQTANFIYYPDNSTVVSNVNDTYLLVNETNADDDASYVQLNTGSLGAFDAQFDSENLRADYSRIVNCRLAVRVKGDPSLDKLDVTLMGYSSSGTPQDVYAETIVLETSEWETVFLNVDSSTVNDAITLTLKYQPQNPLIIFKLLSSSVNGSSKNSSTLKITQVYLEITYVDETTETVYLKENGSWTPVPCVIYQKQNGAWVETTTAVLENGDKYVIQELT